MSDLHSSGPNFSGQSSGISNGAPTELEKKIQDLFDNKLAKGEIVGVPPGSLDDIRSYLGKLPEVDHSEFLARAFAIRLSERTHGEDRSKERKELAHSLALSRGAEKLNENLLDNAGQFSELISLVKKIAKPGDILQRSSGVFGQNEIASDLDELVYSFSQRLATVSALEHSGLVFRDENDRISCQITEAFESGKRFDSSEGEELIDDFQSNVKGYLTVVSEFLVEVDEFPKFCDSLVRSVKSLREGLKERFSRDEESKNNNEPKSLFDFFNQDEQQQEDVPVYRGNLILTGFINEIFKRVPEKPANEELSIDSDGVRPFLAHLNSLASSDLLNQINTPLLFQTLALGVERLHSVYALVLSEYESSNIQTVEDAHSSNKMYTHENILSRSRENALGGELVKGTPFRAFNCRDAIAYLASIDPNAGEEQLDQDLKKSELSKRDKILLESFDSIEKMLERMISSRREVPDSELEPFVIELIEKKDELQGEERKKLHERIKQDKRSSNYCFTAEQEGYGELTLKQVPTPGKRYEDVIGESWKTIKGKLDGLIKYAARSHIYSLMSPRGKINNNMLIVGPYGCGKNMWTKALLSDPSVIGVNATLDRIMSIWHSRSEANVRSLFEHAAEEVIKHEKPAAIIWDEFDSLWGDRGPNVQSYNTDSIKQTMQKNLQSVLDGDTVYEGVALTALSNEPLKIPVPIYRRFAHVEIVQPLTDEERVELLKSNLSWLPLSDGFHNEVDWDNFAERTEYASGDILGKVFDRVFDQYLSAHEEAHPEGLDRVNKIARERFYAGETFEPKDCAELFHSEANDIVVTPQAFTKSAIDVLTQLEIRAAINQQEIFYQNVEKLMEEAFSGSI